MLQKTLACLAVSALVAAGASAQTADQLVEKNIQAKGGRETLLAVKTLRMTGKMSLGQGMEAPFVMEIAPPGHKVRIEFTLQGMTGIQAYDGTTGWQVMPFMGKTEPEAMSGEDAKDVQESSDFFGPMFDYKEKGNKVEYLGKADLEGTPVQKLKVTEKNGDVRTFYLDADSALELKEEASKAVRGQQVDLETAYGNYKQVNGLTIPGTIEVKVVGKPGGQTISIDKIEVNPDIAASRFEMPKVEKKPDAAKPDAAKATPPPPAPR